MGIEPIQAGKSTPHYHKATALLFILIIIEIKFGPNSSFKSNFGQSIFSFQYLTSYIPKAFPIPGQRWQYFGMSLNEVPGALLINYVFFLWQNSNEVQSFKGSIQ